MRQRSQNRVDAAGCVDALGGASTDSECVDGAEIALTQLGALTEVPGASTESKCVNGAEIALTQLVRWRARRCVDAV